MQSYKLKTGERISERLFCKNSFTVPIKKIGGNLHPMVRITTSGNVYVYLYSIPEITAENIKRCIAEEFLELRNIGNSLGPVPADLLVRLNGLVEEREQ